MSPAPTDSSGAGHERAAEAKRWYMPGIGGKLTAAFGALAGVTLVVVAVAFVGGQRLTRDIALAENLRRPASFASTQVQASLLKMQLHVRGYLVLGDPQDVRQYHAARREFESGLEHLSRALKIRRTRRKDTCLGRAG